MEADSIASWLEARDPGRSPLLGYRSLSPPLGYVLGIALWPVYLTVLYGTIFVTESLQLLPSVVSIAVFLGGLLATSISSALVMCVTSWQVSATRIREHSLWVSASLLLAPALFLVRHGLVPVLPSPYLMLKPLGLHAFAEHALITIGFLGPMVGVLFLCFPLLVLGYRSN